MDLLKLFGMFVGLFTGSAAMLASAWVWFRKQMMGLGGASVLASGTIVVAVALAALGDWQVFRIEVSDENWKLEFEKTVARLEVVEAELKSTKKQVDAFQLAVLEKTYRDWELFQDVRKIQSATLKWSKDVVTPWLLTNEVTAAEKFQWTTAEEGIADIVGLAEPVEDGYWSDVWMANPAASATFAKAYQEPHRERRLELYKASLNLLHKSE